MKEALMSCRLRVLSVALVAGHLVGFSGVDEATADMALVTQPVTVGDYRMRVVWPPDGPLPSVTFAQRRGRSLQRHAWYARNSTGLTVTDDLGSGHVRARFAVGGYLDMRFEATEPVSRGAVPLCGRRTRRVGWLVGTLRLPTGAGRFGTVVRHRLRAWLGRGEAFYCEPAWDPGDTPEGWGCCPQLRVGEEFSECPGGRELRIENDYDEGTVQWFQRYKCRSFSHIVVARSARRRLWHTDNWSHARVAGIPPYFAGTLRYAADGRPNHGKFSHGRIRGNLQVKLVVPRTITFARAPALFTMWSP
jgi:hypothetical protein